MPYPAGVQTTEILAGDPLSWDIGHATSAVAIGVFDGVHLGHQEVLSTLRARADEISGKAVALTFDPHPLEFLDPDQAPRVLTTIDQRAEAMSECGVDIMGVLPFLQIRDLDPHLFVSEVLCDRLNAGWVTVGGNFRFGRDRAGDVELLAVMGEESSFGVDVVSMVGHDADNVISSTRIRDVLDTGDVQGVVSLLGRRYAVRGPVVHGDARGRSIGFPTANLHVPARMAVPQNGVYAALACFDGQRHPAVVNIGVRPTFGVNARRVEAHLLDLDLDLYGIEMTLEFVDRIRSEVKFGSIEELRAQIEIDTAQARGILMDQVDL